MAGLTGKRSTTGRMRAAAVVAVAAGTCAAVSVAQGPQTPGTRSDQPPPGVPETPRPFVPPQPNRGGEAEGRPSAGTAERGADPERPRYLVGAVVLKYGLDHPSLPSIDDLLKREVTLGRTEDGYVAPGGGVAEETLTIEDVALQPPSRWTSRALYTVSKAVVDELNRMGVIGVSVTPVESEFAPPGEGDPDWGKDLRRPGQSAVTLLVKVGLVTEMRTLAFGERVPTERRVNSEEHARILAGAPVQVYKPDDPDRLDVLRKDELDDYVFRLNRHPGRRVDVAVAAGAQEGGIALDLLINENRPWLAYFQVSNTGTESTNEWRERFGFTHNQLTGDDDIFSIDYVTAGFDASHAVIASYDRPLWEDWLRGRVFASWNEFTASDVGVGGEEFTGDGWQAGAELVANVFQHRELFVDAFGGFRFQHVEVNNRAASNKGEDDFFLPTVGLRLERQTDTASTRASVALEWNLSDAAGTGGRELQSLGRLNVDDDWTTLQFDAGHSFYLDPLLFGAAWTDTSPGGRATLAHELALSVRGQYAFGNRLIPNEEQVLGGLYTVRGYPESVVAGDSVVVGTAEYRFHIPQAFGYSAEAGELFGKPFRARPQAPYGRADWDLIARGFVDVGRAVNSDRQSYERDETLAGAGVGLELQFRRWLNLRVDWGFALEDVKTSNETVESGDNRVHFVGTIVF